MPLPKGAKSLMIRSFIILYYARRQQNYVDTECDGKTDGFVKTISCSTPTGMLTRDIKRLATTIRALGGHVNTVLTGSCSLVQILHKTVTKLNVIANASAASFNCACAKKINVVICTKCSLLPMKNGTF